MNVFKLKINDNTFYLLTIDAFTENTCEDTIKIISFYLKKKNTTSNIYRKSRKSTQLTPRN